MGVGLKFLAISQPSFFSLSILFLRADNELKIILN